MIQHGPLALALALAISFSPVACGGSTGAVGSDDSGADTGVRIDGSTNDASTNDASTNDASTNDAGARDSASRDAPSDAPTSDANAECHQAATGNACVSCCATKYPGGKSELDLVGFNCMCTSCSASCKASTCQANTPPQSPCIACVKQSLANDCPADPSWTQCSTSCHAYVSCALSCAD